MRVKTFLGVRAELMSGREGEALLENLKEARKKGLDFEITTILGARAIEIRFPVNGNCAAVSPKEHANIVRKACEAAGLSVVIE